MGAQESTASQTPTRETLTRETPTRETPARETPTAPSIFYEEPDDGSDIDNQLHLLRSGEQSDVTLICADKRFMVHTHIIGARSDAFRAMFYDLKEDRTLRIVDIAPNTLEILLHYMYSGEVLAISLKTTLKVYKAADMYEMESLKNICKRFVRQKISEPNASSVLVFASKEDAFDLKDIAVTFLADKKNYLLSESWRRFCEKHPMLANDVFLAFVRRAS